MYQTLSAFAILRLMGLPSILSLRVELVVQQETQSISPSEMLPPAYRICLRPACCREFDWVVGWKNYPSIKCSSYLWSACHGSPLMWQLNAVLSMAGLTGVWPVIGVVASIGQLFYRLWSCHVALQIGPTFKSLPRFGDSSCITDACAAHGRACTWFGAVHPAVWWSRRQLGQDW